MQEHICEYIIERRSACSQKSCQHNLDPDLVKHIDAERYVAEKHKQAILQLQQRIRVRGNVDDYQAKTNRVGSIVKKRLVILRQQQVSGQRIEQNLKHATVNNSE